MSQNCLEWFERNCSPKGSFDVTIKAIRKVLSSPDSFATLATSDSEKDLELLYVSSEGKLSPYVHYLNFKNHIYLLRKHIEKFNLFGVVLYQLIKLISYSIYFILRFRFNKLKMIYKGLIDGMKIKVS